ncbi:hypothetical protein [Methylomonas sp. AM2-LC]|uniref:hypothetical protein n=1 Tax=Methylomonas sp. AM2-LC TaxID=3153301 RepID=UPI003262DDE5
MKTLYYYHPAFLEHNTGPHHPESANRLKVIEQALSKPEFAALIRIQPQMDADIINKLRLIHTPAMIDKVLNSIPEQGFASLDADTLVSTGSKQAALLAVSAVCAAVDHICQSKAKRAFCAVRPPGHHAEPQQAMGFCLFNNIAIAAAYALNHYKLDRVAIVDFDVHHGNGTQAAFIDNPHLFYASSLLALIEN